MERKEKDYERQLKEKEEKIKNLEKVKINAKEEEKKKESLEEENLRRIIDI